MNIEIDEIVSIEEVDVDSLRYDITVENNHNFFANDILVHNCQNLVSQIKHQIAGKTFEKTIKLDGTSMTVFYHNEEHGVAGRNWELRETEANTLWRVSRKNQLIEALVSLGRNIALRGELIGEGIQENNEKIFGHEFYLFNIWDIDAQQYLTPEVRDQVVQELIAHGAKIKQVPSEGFITFPEDVTVEDILALADGKSLFAENREGIVFKRVDGQFSFKAISNWYLLKHSNR
jgi:RNA ligase (TIGR02306 family)